MALPFTSYFFRVFHSSLSIITWEKKKPLRISVEAIFFLNFLAGAAVSYGAA